MLPDSIPKKPVWRSPESLARRAAYRKQWRKDNRERVNEQARTLRAKDPVRQQEYYRRWKESHPEYRRSPESLVRDAETQRRKVQWFYRNLRVLKDAQGCADCGATGDLLHHHVNPQTKRYCVTGMAGCSLETWLDEVAKCVVLCRSCHKKRHDAIRRIERKTDEEET
jgi:hypothetical protein